MKVPFLRDSFENLKPLGQAMHKRVMNDFRQYVLIGGMPQAVEAYMKSKSFEDADRIKKRILTLYREDITKFVKGYEAKVLSIFDEMPTQLSKTEKNINCQVYKRVPGSVIMRMLLCGWRKR